MRAIVFSDGGEESRQQVEALEKVAKRFPDLQIEVQPSDGELAAEFAVVIPPGLVIDGVALSIGRVLSPGRIRRFVIQHSAGAGQEDTGP
jgi:hypothetical protein